MISIGIDPGFTGAMVMMQPCENGIALSGQYTPITGKGKSRELDLAQLRSILCRWDSSKESVFVTLEKVGSMPKQGVSSTFKFGCGYGKIQGLLAGLQIPFELVTPQAWKKKVLEGMDWKGNKAASIQYVQKKYPAFDLLRTPKCRKLHDGMADALCLAEYGRLTDTPF